MTGRRVVIPGIFIMHPLFHIDVDTADSIDDALKRFVSMM